MRDCSQTDERMSEHWRCTIRVRRVHWMIHKLTTDWLLKTPRAFSQHTPPLQLPATAVQGWSSDATVTDPRVVPDPLSCPRQWIGAMSNQLRRHSRSLVSTPLSFFFLPPTTAQHHTLVFLVLPFAANRVFHAAALPRPMFSSCPVPVPSLNLPHPLLC